MTENKTEWVRDFDEKCRYEFVDASNLGNNSSRFVWPLDSYIQVANGLNMFNKEAIIEFLDSKRNKNQILEFAKEHHEYTVLKKNENKHIPHKQIIASIHK
jgi:hypothetical protein